jgi:hypothetical protein
MKTLLRYARHDIRRLARLLTPPVALLLLVSLVVGSTHRHEGAADHQTCAVCNVGHAPAHVAPEPAAVAAAAPSPTRYALVRPERPADIARHTTPSRAPPTHS